MAGVELRPLPPAEAIRFFRAKGFRLGFDWRDVWQEEHALSFTVAKATSLDLLRDIRTEVDRAIAEGTTLQEFTETLRPRLQARGWWGRRRMVDPLTGDESVVQLGSPRRLRTIYRANLRTAYSAGRWERIQRVKGARPYLRYVTADDDLVRHSHARWHGIVLLVDDRFWLVYYPPNGWGCRCGVQQLSERDLRRLGYEVSESPEIRTRRWRNKRTGAVEDVPEGIDPGFGYNVGVARDGDAAVRLLDKAAELPPAAGADLVGEVGENFRRALDGQIGRWVDDVRAAGRPRGQVRPVGMLSADVLAALEARGVAPATGVITVADRQILHALRTAKAAPVPAADLRRLPAILRRPQAVLRDRRDGDILYVFAPSSGAGRGKIVVRVDFRQLGRPSGGGRATLVTNAVRTLGRVPVRNLTGPDYEVITGAI